MLHMCLDCADAAFYITIQISVLKGCLPDRQFLFSADIRDFMGILFAQICAKLIINLQKQIRILRISRQLYDIADIHHNPVRKKCHVRIAHPIWNSVSFQKINQRKSAFMIPVKNCSLICAPRCHLQKIRILRVSVRNRNLPQFPLLWP